MRDEIQKVITTEGEARLLIETAQAEADRIISEARRIGQVTDEQARQDALNESEKILDVAIETAESEKQRRLADAAIDIERQIRLEPSTRQWALEEVIRCLCKQP